MQLRTYLESQPRGAIAELAAAIGVNRVLVSQWTSGDKPRPIPLEHIAAIEKATGGQVMRWDLRPEDWHRIWPELIGAEGAPAVASQEAA